MAWGCSLVVAWMISFNFNQLIDGLISASYLSYYILIVIQETGQSLNSCLGQFNNNSRFTLIKSREPPVTEHSLSVKTK